MANHGCDWVVRDTEPVRSEFWEEADGSASAGVMGRQASAQRHVEVLKSVQTLQAMAEELGSAHEPLKPPPGKVVPPRPARWLVYSNPHEGEVDPSAMPMRPRSASAAKHAFVVRPGGADGAHLPARRMEQSAINIPYSQPWYRPQQIKDSLAELERLQRAVPQLKEAMRQAAKERGLAEKLGRQYADGGRRASNARDLRPTGPAWPASTGGHAPPHPSRCHVGTRRGR